MRRATGSLPLPRGRRSLFAHHRGVVAEGLGLQVAPRGGEGLVRAARGQKDPEAINVAVVALVDSRLPVAARRPRAAELVHASRRSEAAVAAGEGRLELEGEITPSLPHRMFLIRSWSRTTRRRRRPVTATDPPSTRWQRKRGRRWRDPRLR